MWSAPSTKCVACCDRMVGLLFVEHGLAPEQSVRRWQHRFTPAWKRFAGGCHLDRPIKALIKDAGFEVERLQTGYMEGQKLLTFL